MYISHIRIMGMVQLVSSWRISWHCLFTRLSLWRSWLMMLCEGPSSAYNVQLLAFGCWRTISSKASSSATESVPDLLFVFKAYVTFIEMSEPVLCNTFVISSWAFHSINFFWRCSCSPFFLLWGYKMALIAIFFTIHNWSCKIKNKQLMFICYIWK